MNLRIDWFYPRSLGIYILVYTHRLVPCPVIIREAPLAVDGSQCRDSQPDVTQREFKLEVPI